MEALSTASESLQRLFEEVVRWYDCSVLEGHREKERQDEKQRTGKSKVKWPNSRHNSKPSEAVDAVRYPVHWPSPGIDRRVKLDPELKEYVKRIAEFYHFAGYVQGTARQMGIELRWGGDWDSDREFLDNVFDDLPHFELPKEGK